MDLEGLKMRLARQSFQHLTTLSFGCLLAGMNEFSKNAKFALVIAEPPKNIHREPDLEKWKDFLGCIPQFARPNKETTLIYENVWLIPLDSGMRFLSQLFDLASGKGIPLRILFLDEEPEWIKYPPDAKPAYGAKPSQPTS